MHNEPKCHHLTSDMKMLFETNTCVLANVLFVVLSRHSGVQGTQR